MQRRTGVVVALAAAVATLVALSGCSAGSTSGAKKGTVTITLVGDSGPANVKTQKKIIGLFEKAHPDIKVKFEGATLTT